MFSDISTFGWILIIGLVVFIVTLNLGLFLGIRHKMKKDNWIDKMTAVGRILKDPLKKENDQYQELSDQVAKIKLISAKDIKDKLD